MNVRIITDSTCDLPLSVLKEKNIPMVPLFVHMGDDARRDGVDVMPDDLYSWADTNKSTPKTSAPSPEMARQLLSECYEEGREVFYTGISETLSATPKVIDIARQAHYPNMRLALHDSQGVSLKVGAQVLRAYELAQQGLTLDELTKEMLAYRERVRITFIIESTLFLYRGGRCSALTNLGAGLLNIKPSIIMKEGALVPGPRFHGRMEKSVRAYMKNLEPDLLNADTERLYLLNSGHVNEEAYAHVESILKTDYAFKEIVKLRAGSVISSHCGPGTIGLVYLLR